MGQGSAPGGCRKASDLVAELFQAPVSPGIDPTFRYKSCHGQMASTFRRKNLVCFYCNKKSSIKYDGLITQWECSCCDANNYLDEHGDITDPPVGTTHPSSSGQTYSLGHSSFSPSQISSQTSSFCSTCLKNQHLYTASLAQYHVEIDPSHPNYKESEKQYYKYRASLEKRYPQCCIDCEPMAVERMKDSSKTAKSDYARRLMNKSRTRRLAERTSRFSIGDAVDFIGRFLWFIGLILQILWDASTVADITENEYLMTLDSSQSPLFTRLLSIASTASSHLPAGKILALCGLWCTGLSLWWTPKFQNLNRGFMNQVSGYGDWYKHQLISFTLRCLFYFVMRQEHFAKDFAAPTQAAHGFILVFILALAYRSTRFIKVDMNKLWDNPPEKVPFVGPSGSPSQGGNSMEDILNGISSTRPSQSKPAFTPSPPSYREPFRPQPYVPGSIRVGQGRPAVPMQPLKGLDLTEFRRRASPPFLNNRYNSSSGDETSLDQQYPGLDIGTSMDWSPSQPVTQPASQLKSQHRAFTENLPADKDAEFFGQVSQKEPTKLFGQTPIAAERSTFWYKVPPAPVTPARQVRNPPNQPSMRVASQERKDNFFNNVTGRVSTWQQPSETAASRNQGSQRQGIEFAQQKFFPSSPNEEPDELIESFGSWSLGDSRKLTKTNIAQQKSTRRYISQGIVLFCSLLFWNHTMNNSSDTSKIAALAIMFGCLCIGVRNILDNTIWAADDKETDSVLAHTFGSILGGCELALAGYAIIEIYAERGACENYGTLGTIFIGAMMVHQMWKASFG